MKQQWQSKVNKNIFWASYSSKRLRTMNTTSLPPRKINKKKYMYMPVHRKKGKRGEE
jgi:hypothetical protein